MYRYDIIDHETKKIDYTVFATDYASAYRLAENRGYRNEFSLLHINKEDMQCSVDDLKALFIACKNAYKGYSYDMFQKECKNNYIEYAKTKRFPKSYSQWINGQIIALIWKDIQ